MLKKIAATAGLTLSFLLGLSTGILVSRSDAASVKWNSSLATWYGPGLYGNTMTCGKKLTRNTIGVAHRSMKCGTRIRFRHRGRYLTVRVVDRGPFSAATWDLTEAAKIRLGWRAGQIEWRKVR